VLRSRLLVARLLALLLLIGGVVPVGASAAALQGGGDLQPEWLQDGLDGYWEGVFEDAELQYEAPDVEVYDEDIETDCGEAVYEEDGAGDAAFYCPADATVYVADGAYEAISDDESEEYWVLGIARLWGNHALWLVEYEDLDDEEEPYPLDDDSSEIAYCLAGAYGAWAVDEDELDADDVEGYIEDSETEDYYDALSAGYEDGLEGCELDLADLGGGGGGGEDGEVYESPTYGYTLTFDPAEWEYFIEDEDPDDPYDFQCFSNNVSVVCLSGNPDYAEDEMIDCVDDYGAGLETLDGNSDVEEYDDPDAFGDDDGVAWGTYSYHYEDPDGAFEDDYVRYFECRYVGDGVTVVILHDAQADVYEDEVEAREALVEGLDAGGSSGGGEEEEEEPEEEDEPEEDDEDEDEEEDDSSAKRPS
jgi:hypothetical protein